MRREEEELRGHFREAFDRYAETVPLFFPRGTPARLGDSAGEFSLTQYKKNHEWQAALGFLLLIGALFLICYFRQC